MGSSPPTFELIKSQKKDTKFSFDLYENDTNLIPLLKHNMKACKENLDDEGFEISYRIFNEDFILSNAPKFDNKTESDDLDHEGYDLAISNPPYYKLKKDAPPIIKMKNIVEGAPNIYPLFMALSAISLKKNGQMVLLTSRSYCSGLYFRNFRKWFLKVVKPHKIHLFESRSEVFKRYNVLQEILILTAMKIPLAPEKINVSTSFGEPIEMDNSMVRSFDYHTIVFEKNDDIIIRILTSELDEYIVSKFDEFEYKLNTLGFGVSTGPVVPFRSKDYLLKDVNVGRNSVPLIWMQNIKNGRVIWPIPINNKSIAIENKKESSKLLVPIGNLVLIKRFSVKEGKQRINAGVFLEKKFSTDFIGIENHVNYIFKRDCKLTENEAYGIAALLNSKLYNRYFQMSNGSTQINVTEIINLPFPSLEKIRILGRSIRHLKSEDDVTKERNIIMLLSFDEHISTAL